VTPAWFKVIIFDADGSEITQFSSSRAD